MCVFHEAFPRSYRLCTHTHLGTWPCSSLPRHFACDLQHLTEVIRQPSPSFYSLCCFWHEIQALCQSHQLEAEHMTTVAKPLHTIAVMVALYLVWEEAAQKVGTAQWTTPKSRMAGTRWGKASLWLQKEEDDPNLQKFHTLIAHGSFGNQ
jgi:hypothetical protein